ncbi:hypothetical protein ZWY2020_025240 [Hordeum vulgare]|nr:hypothetical protein ZWY2020_025240 [Hordeum vulgare]
MAIVEFGAGGKLSAPGEYPCVRRVRHRRLLTYLSSVASTTFQRISRSRLLILLAKFSDYLYDVTMTQETDAHLCRLHLRQLVARGLWSNALNYLRRFFDPDASCTLDLVWFLNAFWVLDNMAAKHGAMRTGAAVYYHDVSLSTYLSRNAKLSSIINTMANSQQFRLSLDWQLVRRRASFVVYQLLLESPELRRLLILPRETLNPQQLLPIGPRQPKTPREETSPRPTATAMARLYLNTKRSSRHHAATGAPSMTPPPVLRWDVDLHLEDVPILRKKTPLYSGGQIQPLPHSQPFESDADPLLVIRLSYNTNPPQRIREDHLRLLTSDTPLLWCSSGVNQKQFHIVLSEVLLPQRATVSRLKNVAKPIITSGSKLLTPKHLVNCTLNMVCKYF